MGFSEPSGPQSLFSPLLTFLLTLGKRPWDRVAPVGVRWLIPTLSQSSRSRSTRILISSGMAKDGWVSLSWMATYRGRVAVRIGSRPRTIVSVPCPFRVPKKPDEVLWLGWNQAWWQLEQCPWCLKILS